MIDLDVEDRVTELEKTVTNDFRILDSSLKYLSKRIDDVEKKNTALETLLKMAFEILLQPHERAKVLSDVK
jgi:hypothetical protein